MNCEAKEDIIKALGNQYDARHIRERVMRETVKL